MVATQHIKMTMPVAAYATARWPQPNDVNDPSAHSTKVGATSSTTRRPSNLNGIHQYCCADEATSAEQHTSTACCADVKLLLRVASHAYADAQHVVQFSADHLHLLRPLLLQGCPDGPPAETAPFQPRLPACAVAKLPHHKPHLRCLSPLPALPAGPSPMAL